MIQKRNETKKMQVRRYLTPKLVICSVKQQDVVTTSEGKAIGDASFDKIQDDKFIES